MWLLDANLDVHLLALLEEFGKHAEAATRRGWQTLSNGDLVAAAVAAGFTCLLTHDRLFGESAARALRQFPEFAVVLVRLPQQPWRQYCDGFRAKWVEHPIRTAAGRLVEWP